jgi:ribosomal protein L5
MALPKLDTPTYELEQPSTGEKIKYRPFLVKEQKILMMAQESQDDKQIRDALANLITSCTFKSVDPYEIPMFDVEYFFLRIRGKSVGETVDLNLLCPDDNETTVKKTVNLEEIGVNMKVGHTNEINITDSIKMIMKYPTLNDIVDIDTDIENTEDMFSLVKRCVWEIRHGEKVYNKVDISDKELEEFIDSLTTDQFEKITDFFDTMPKVQHSVEITNPKTKKKGEVVIEGIQSFFD